MLFFFTLEGRTLEPGNLVEMQGYDGDNILRKGIVEHAWIAASSQQPVMTIRRWKQIDAEEGVYEIDFRCYRIAKCNGLKRLDK